jgi:hypothetical protein
MESRLLASRLLLFGLAKEFLPRINWYKAVGMGDVGGVVSRLDHQSLA